MSDTRDHDLGSQSPQSSRGLADSIKGTPDTRSTAFSPKSGPGDRQKQPSTFYGSDVPAAQPGFPLQLDGFRGQVHLEKDPFVAPSQSTSTSLSPTASTFTPNRSACRLVTPSSITDSLSRKSRTLSSSSKQELTSEEVEELLKSCHSHPAANTTQEDGLVQVHFHRPEDALATSNFIRSCKSEWEVHLALQPSALDGEPNQSGGHHSRQNAVANPRLPQHRHILVQAMGRPRSNATPSQIMNIAHKFLALQGELSTFFTYDVLEAPHMALVSFHDPDITKAVVINYAGGILVQDVHMLFTAVECATGHSSEFLSSPWAFLPRFPRAYPVKPVDDTSSALRNVHDQARQRKCSLFNEVLGRWDSAIPLTVGQQSSLQDSGDTDRSPSTGATLTSGHFWHDAFVGIPPSPMAASTHPPSSARPQFWWDHPELRRQNAARVNRSPFFAANGQHNYVDSDRIRDGIDVRTTIMLRNIPNKVDQAMLKGIIDQSSWGKYDFMYLRIDFANDCNVGYAFINFVDPLDIIHFVDTRGNQRWNCFKSDKIAEISYATIQGKDCLVQKFRNSSVMLEAPHYRPKLFYTLNGPIPEVAGEEEPFPEPDNQSKMRRSCENAEHVGLFTPNAGQHFRDEQRRRRSQFDRGTRLAALEEHDFSFQGRTTYVGASP